jgi:NAD(P)-dependent dehydrogenase (short-subunit alcohol dehydrogenase family)
MRSTLGSRVFGSRTTAEEVVRGVSLAGKKAIVTGANSGIGTETARVLALSGADVVMACRSASADAVARGVQATLPSGSGGLEVRRLDLSDFASIRAFAEPLIAEERSLDILINNAGIMATPFGTTTQGTELQVGTNHVGHVLLTKLLLPLLSASASARVVNVSSALHTRGNGERLLETLTRDPAWTMRRYVPFDAYGDSKLANVLFTRELAKVLPSSIAAFSLHPGVIPTNLTRSMGAAGAVFRTVGAIFTKTIEQGAATTVFAATARELDGRSGAYLSDCAVRRASSQGSDDKLASRVWTATEDRIARS